MGPDWRKKEKLLSCVAYRSLSLPRTSCHCRLLEVRMVQLLQQKRKQQQQQQYYTVVASRASIHTPLESKGELHGITSITCLAPVVQDSHRVSPLDWHPLQTPAAVARKLRDIFLR